jgi:hypothetical protein
VIRRRKAAASFFVSTPILSSDLADGADLIDGDLGRTASAAHLQSRSPGRVQLTRQRTHQRIS